MASQKIQQRQRDSAAEAVLLNAGFPATLAGVFSARGIQSSEDLNTSLSGMLDWRDLLNVDKAAEMLIDAIDTDKRITIACDFDVDGCSAGSVAIRGLKMMGAKNVSFAMPRREIEGYGLSPLLVQKIYDKFSPDIILTVDCGISSHAGVEKAIELGARVLVTDHHLCAADVALPRAEVIVNPNQPDCRFSSKNLAGVGVIFYVMIALRAKLREKGRFEGTQAPDLRELLDLVALATIADVVKLDKNNRILVENGLKRIRSNQACQGIKALMDVASKMPSKASVFDCAFCLGPRINSSGRLEDASTGVKCLTTDDPVQAKELAKKLDDLNVQRREIESDMKGTAEFALEGVDVGDRFSLVMHDKSWHQGVIGILASRLKDAYGRPTIAFADGGDGKLKGSCRSIPGLHLRDALDIVSKRNPGMLPAFGGHAMAAGVTCMADRFDDFVVAFELAVREMIDASVLQQIIWSDGSLSGAELNLKTAEMIEKYVWGHGFPEPVFDDVFSVSDQRILGEKHLKLMLSKDGVSVPAIWFFRNELLPDKARVVYSISVNEYKDNRNAQLLVKYAEPVPDLFEF